MTPSAYNINGVAATGGGGGATGSGGQGKSGSGIVVIAYST